MIQLGYHLAGKPSGYVRAWEEFVRLREGGSSRDSQNGTFQARIS
jgi:hypothetical protein